MNCLLFLFHNLNFLFDDHNLFSSIIWLLFMMLFLFRKLFPCGFNQTINWLNLFFDIIYFFFFFHTFLLNIIKLFWEYFIKVISFFHLISMLFIETFASKIGTAFSAASSYTRCIIRWNFQFLSKWIKHMLKVIFKLLKNK